MKTTTLKKLWLDTDDFCNITAKLHDIWKPDFWQTNKCRRTQVIWLRKGDVVESVGKLFNKKTDLADIQVVSEVKMFCDV